MHKVLIEASGSLTSGYIIKAIQDAGCLAVASDINPKSVGRFLADDFILMPSKNALNLWNIVSDKISEYQVNVVIPSFDEMLLGWARRKTEFSAKGVEIIISPPETIEVFLDKWLTYKFFSSNNIPTPITSLEQDYLLVKPRNGRGAAGVQITTSKVSMEGMISQEVLEGEEYTIDVFCNKSSEPIYIVPRKRIDIKEGKSTAGVVVKSNIIEEWIKKICSKICFQGPINIQGFVSSDSKVKFTEINPRIAGGMALGFAASENWVNLIINHFIDNKDIVAKSIMYGMEMKRYYAEIFIPSSGLE